jgi:hypothetical protein
MARLAILAHWLATVSALEISANDFFITQKIQYYIFLQLVSELEDMIKCRIQYEAELFEKS